MGTEWDPLEALKEMCDAEPRQGGQALSFPMQCVAFCFLKGGMSPGKVARRLKVSPSAMSQLGRCEARPADKTHQWRYGKVALEYEALGHDAFVRRYLTEDVRARFFSGQLAAIPLGGANALSDKWAGKPFAVPLVTGGSVRCIVEWIAEDPVGWTWRLYPDGEWSPKRFRTSGQAYDWAYEAHAADSPRPQAGRRKVWYK
jgi:hypothetical protein